MKSIPERSLYAITDTTLCARSGVVTAVRRVLAGGAGMIQYRDKTADRLRRRREVADLLVLCREHGAALIVNDDVDLAGETGADGVHLGRDDARLQSARHQLGEGAIIGVSCYDSVDAAREAETLGADYVAFGRFFASATKPQASPARVETVRSFRARSQLPIAAIGGITPENALPLLEAGVNLLAVIGALFAAPDPEKAARRFALLLERI